MTTSEAESWVRVHRAAVDAVAAIPKPTVAAITGYALGAGLGLALAADWRVSGDNVRFGATEILAGLVPGGDGMARLARTVGASRAKELVYSGRFFDAEEALELGLIDEMVAPDGVYDAAAAWASRFVDGPRVGVRRGQGRHRRRLRAASGRALGCRAAPLPRRLRRQLAAAGGQAT